MHVFYHPDIEARPDMQLESDLKLDRLETFLRRLNNKGTLRPGGGFGHLPVAVLICVSMGSLGNLETPAPPSKSLKPNSDCFFSSAKLSSLITSSISNSCHEHYLCCYVVVIAVVMAAPYQNTWRFLGQGLNPSCSCNLHCIHGNARSFTPLNRAGIQTHTSRVIQAASVGFLTHWAMAGTPCC